jgi:DNA modification methylase
MGKTPAAIPPVINQEYEYVAPQLLKPHPRNARQGDRGAIYESIKANGFYGACVVQRSTGHILVGNHRYFSAVDAQLPAIPVIYVDCDDDAALRILLSDNKTSDDANYDDNALAALLAELANTDAGLAGTGFSGDDLDQLISDLANGGGMGGGGTELLTDPDAVPEDAPTRVKPGDLWRMGEHRLLCGDGAVAADVDRLLCGERPGAMVTDPPYCSGGFQEAGKKSGSIGTRGDEMIANDTLSTRGYTALMKQALTLCRAGVIYVFTDWRMWVNLFDVAEGSGYGVRNMVVWDKGTPGMGRGWRSQHELILVGMKVTQPFDPHKAQGNVIGAQRTGNKLHPTEKPVSLIETLLDVTDMARTVYDPFGGSGTTLIACEKMGRTAYLCELSPTFCDTILARWEAATGKTAELVT